MDIKELSDQNVRIRKMVIEICPGKIRNLRYSFDIQLLGAHIGKVAVCALDPLSFVIFFFFHCYLIIFKNHKEPAWLVHLIPCQITAIKWKGQA